jgi:hypothetical protein
MMSNRLSRGGSLGYFKLPSLSLSVAVGKIILRTAAIAYDI